MSVLQNDLELILKSRFSKQNSVKTADIPSTHLRSAKGADLDDLANMLAKLVSKSMRKQNVEFLPDEGARPIIDQSIKIDAPRIYFSVIDSVPKKELKPMLREEINELTEDKRSRRMGFIYGKRYVNIVQFDVFAPNYTEANTVMKNFEELIFDYSSYLKENGIEEIYLQKRFTDRNLDQYRQRFSIRSLQYYVETERLVARFGETIESVTPVPAEQP